MVVEVIEDAVRREDEDVTVLHLNACDGGIARLVLEVITTEDGGLETHSRRDNAKLVWSVEGVRLRRGVLVDGCETEED